MNNNIKNNIIKMRQINHLIKFRTIVTLIQKKKPF
jgi:hypothetical protein